MCLGFADGRSRPHSIPLEAPAFLSAAERAYWGQWEPLARRLETLAAQTAPGFALLCQVAAEVDTLREVLTLAKWEITPGVVHPRAASYRNHVLRLEQLQARYGLAASGRQVVLPRQEESEDDVSKWSGILPRPRDAGSDFYSDASPRRRAN